MRRLGRTTNALPAVPPAEEADVDPRAVDPAPELRSTQFVLEATRELLWCDSVAEVSAVARDLVQELGGTLAPAENDPASALPLDMSFGDGEPVVVVPESDEARSTLERHLPTFVRDAHRLLELSDRRSRLAQDASRDALTGLDNRRTMDRLLARLDAHDVLVLVDLDHFKDVNDTWGHEQGDQVLMRFADVLRETVRAADHAGRFGGEEFLVVLRKGDPVPFLTRLQDNWRAARPRPVTFSAGVTAVEDDPGRALVAADRALYRAKRAGRDQWCWATAEDRR